MSQTKKRARRKGSPWMHQHLHQMAADLNHCNLASSEYVVSEWAFACATSKNLYNKCYLQ